MGRRGEQLLAGLAGDRPEVCGLGGTVPDNGCGGPSRSGNPDHGCAHQMLKGVHAASPHARAQLLALSPGAGKLHSYGACLT